MSEKLYIVPQRHPDQASLPPERRDEVIASQLGAQWSGQDGGFVIPDGIPGARREEIENRFSGETAKERFDKSIDRLAELPASAFPGLWNKANSNRGSNIVGREGISTAAVYYQKTHDGLDAPAHPSLQVSQRKDKRDNSLSTGGAESPGSRNDGERYYYYTSSDPRDTYSISRLMQQASAQNIGLSVDQSRNEDGTRTEYYGLRYSVGREHPELSDFRTPEARESWQKSNQNRREARNVIANTATKVADRDARQLTPLTLPKPPDKNHPKYNERMAAFERAGEGIRTINTKKLTRLVRFNEVLLDHLNKRSKFLESEGKKLTGEEMQEYGRLRRGYIFGKNVLEEREREETRRHRRAEGRDLSKVSNKAGRGAASSRSDESEVR